MPGFAARAEGVAPISLPTSGLPPPVPPSRVLLFVPACISCTRPRRSCSAIQMAGFAARAEVARLLISQAFQPPYRGTSLIRNRAPLDPTVGLCLGLYVGPRGGGLFLMSEVPLYHPPCTLHRGAWWHRLRGTAVLSHLNTSVSSHLNRCVSSRTRSVSHGTGCC